MKTYLATKLASVSTVLGIKWQTNIYSSRLMESPANLLDCLNECAFVQIGICQFFVFENGTCFLGRGDITNGTVAQSDSKVTIYVIKGKAWTSLNKMHDN